MDEPAVRGVTAPVPAGQRSAGAQRQRVARRVGAAQAECLEASGVADRLEDNIRTGYALWGPWYDLTAGGQSCTQYIEAASARDRPLIDNMRARRLRNAQRTHPPMPVPTRPLVSLYVAWHPDFPGGRAVAVALGNCLRTLDEPPRDAINAVTAALSDDELLVRAHAAWALGGIASAAAREALIARLPLETENSVRHEIELDLP